MHYLRANIIATATDRAPYRDILAQACLSSTILGNRHTFESSTSVLRSRTLASLVTTFTASSSCMPTLSHSHFLTEAYVCRIGVKNILGFRKSVFLMSISSRRSSVLRKSYVGASFPFSLRFKSHGKVRTLSRRTDPPICRCVWSHLSLGSSAPSMLLVNTFRRRQQPTAWHNWFRVSNEEARRIQHTFKFALQNRLMDSRFRVSQHNQLRQLE